MLTKKGKSWKQIVIATQKRNRWKEWKKNKKNEFSLEIRMEKFSILFKSDDFKEKFN